MPRIRTLKPEFWQDEDLSGLAPETHLLAAALLNHADDEGYFKANPKLVKAACCPLREDSTSVRRGLDELSRVGYVALYRGTDGKEYGHISNFTTHQRIDRASESKIKPLISELLTFDEDSTNNQRGLDEGSTPEQGTGNREQGTGNVEDSDESSSAETADPCPHKKIIRLYHEILPTLPRVREDMWAGSESARALRARWHEEPKRQSLDWWRKFFERIAERCPFLLGHGEPNPKTGKVWSADLRWIVKRENFTKILEGRYVAKGREDAA